MGYYSGGQCFADQVSASNFILSQVVPSISSDGSLKTVVFNESDQKWYYGNQEVRLSFPDCEMPAGFDEGIQVALLLVSGFIIAFFFRLIYKILWQSVDKSTD